MKEGDVLWRALAQDRYGFAGEHETVVQYERWKVLRFTPCGVWLTSTYGRRVWRKRVYRFVQSSKPLALAALIRRTSRWVEFERARLNRATRRLQQLQASCGDQVAPSILESAHFE